VCAATRVVADEVADYEGGVLVVGCLVRLGGVEVECGDVV
jgi:hypothetical protein